ncbi:hypothetical protein [Acidiferrobacter sp.]
MQLATYKVLRNTQEIVIYEQVLPYINAQYGKQFQTLIVPDVIAVDLTRQHGCLKHYEGTIFNEVWQHENGGSDVDQNTVCLFIDIMHDLQRIEPEEVKDILVRNGISPDTFTFDLLKWKSGLQDPEKRRILSALLGGPGFSKLTGIQIDGPTVFSNGDYYIRNLVGIERTGIKKCVLVDWSYFDGFRCCYIDYIVNVLAFAYIHMWGNTAWQSSFKEAACAQFSISESNFNGAVALKAVEQYLFLTKDKDDGDSFSKAMKDIINNNLA